MRRHPHLGMYNSVPIEQSDAMGYGSRRMKPRKAVDPLTISAHTARLMAAYIKTHGRRPKATDLAPIAGIGIRAMQKRIRSATKDGFVRLVGFGEHEPEWHLLPERLQAACPRVQHERAPVPKPWYINENYGQETTEEDAGSAQLRVPLAGSRLRDAAGLQVAHCTTVQRSKGGIKHGGAGTAYAHYKCRCAECREANTARCRRARQARATKPVPESVKHGASCYVNWSCRCDVCREAWRVRCYQAHLRRKARKAA